MKRFLIPFLLCLALLAGGVALLLRALPDGPAPLEDPGPAQEAGPSDAAPDETAGHPETPGTAESERSVQGVLLACGDGLLSLVRADGVTLRFSLGTAGLHTPEGGARQGFPVTVRYTGELDLSAETQPVTVLSAEISDFTGLTDDEAAQQILSTLTLEQKVGQLFLARCPDTGAAETAAEGGLGGYVLFARDFEDETPDSIRDELAQIQTASALPLLLAVDEEGGTVCRVSCYAAFRAERFLSPQALLAQGGLDAVVADTQEKAALLQDLGLNVNLAPVADVSQNPDDFIYDRTAGLDAAGTSEYVAAVVTAAREAGLGTALKHFPGYGDNEDTHTGIAWDARPYSQFEQADFLPFAAGIEAGADAVLVSHNIVSCLDPTLPASLSRESYRALREELGFTGVAMTDDLAMQAIGDFTDASTAAVTAVNAGADLLICTDFETQLPAVLAAAQDGTIPLSRIDEACTRVLLWKLRLGLFGE